MTVRTASCPCGQLQARCEGDPVRISVCHCLHCQRRSGSAFAVQARWPDDRIVITGERRSWQRIGESGEATTLSFCPDCGATVTYTNEGLPGVTAVAVGAFADPEFPSPTISIYEERKHRWIDIVGDIEHD